VILSSSVHLNPSQRHHDIYFTCDYLLYFHIQARYNYYGSDGAEQLETLIGAGFLINRRIKQLKPLLSAADIL
jgi:hypothetical protein